MNTVLRRYSNLVNFGGGYGTGPGISVHGSFSITVNLHALGVFASSIGGFPLLDPHADTSIRICAFVVPAAPQKQRVEDGGLSSATSRNTGVGLQRPSTPDTHSVEGYPHLSEEFQSGVAAFGPGDLIALKPSISNAASPPEPEKTISATVRLHFF